MYWSAIWNFMFFLHGLIFLLFFPFYVCVSNIFLRLQPIVLHHGNLPKLNLIPMIIDCTIHNSYKLHNSFKFHSVFCVCWNCSMCHSLYKTYIPYSFNQFKAQKFKILAISFCSTTLMTIDLFFQMLGSKNSLKKSRWHSF